MPLVIVLALVAIAALIVVGLALHFLLSPWLLVAVGILVCIKLWPRRSRR